uniref:Pectate lyase n=1 Tax=Oryza meridionalis TaxID=40149 RepID=A0A0E0E383_9ORYZ
MEVLIRWSKLPAAGSLVLYAVFLLLSAAATSEANIWEYDEYWQKRKLMADAAAEATYKRDPFEVTNSFNRAVHRHADRSSEEESGRRELAMTKRKKFAGPCKATNPIDRCWRCRADWVTDRKRLARCAQGFGRNTTGGLAGKFYLVTDGTDDDVENPRPGTLRWGVIQDEPLWIIFAKDMIINLKEEMMINSDKTIDGRGAQVRITNGAQVTVQNSNNVIIHNIHIHDILQGKGGMIRDSPEHFGFRTQSDGDGISIFGSTNVWLDHLSLSNCQDGLIDVIAKSTGVTISNCHLTNHNDVMLFGSSDSFSEDQIMQITVAFNHFGRGLVQRMPRCRWGFFHVVNNDYTHWLMYAIGGSKNPTIISQGNRYIAPPNLAAKRITKQLGATEEEWKNWVWHSEEDLFMEGAYFTTSGGPIQKQFSNKDLIKPKPGSYVTRLTRFAGSIPCVAGKPC